MARTKEYTPEALDRAVDRYFRSITRKVAVTERKDSGQRDKDGHAIYEEVPVVNDLGKEVVVTEYIVPPSKADLCEFLHIHRSTWSNYSDASLHPELQEITERVHERLKAWNERELLTRPGKDLKGILFNLENNYGYRERIDATVRGGADELLAKLAEQGEEAGV